MKARDLSTITKSVEVYGDGHTFVGRTTSTAVDKLNVGTSVVGDFVHPNPFSYQKIVGSGLRGRTKRSFTGGSSIPASVLVSSSGGYSSVLDTKGLVRWESDATAAYNSAVSALSSVVRGDLDLAIDAFQFKQTLKSAERFVNLTKTLRNSWYNVLRRQGPIKEVANHYLEWTYGILPVVSDMLETMKKLRDDGLTGKPFAHFRGRGNHRIRSTLAQQALVHGSISIDLLFELESEYRCQLDVYLKADTSQIQKVGGYASLNPVSWVYESVPYSFVLDWAWNFGGYMRDLETAVLHSPRYAYGNDTRSLKQNTRLLKVKTGSIWMGDGWISFDELNGSHTFKGMDRFVLTSYPLPRLPVLDLKLGSKRMLNAAALLAQFLPDMFNYRRGRDRINGRTFPLIRGR